MIHVFNLNLSKTKHIYLSVAYVAKLCCLNARFEILEVNDISLLLNQVVLSSVPRWHSKQCSCTLQMERKQSAILI